jgi:hypothetical protein
MTVIENIVEPTFVIYYDDQIEKFIVLNTSGFAIEWFINKNHKMFKQQFNDKRKIMKFLTQEDAIENLNASIDIEFIAPEFRSANNESFHRKRYA